MKQKKTQRVLRFSYIRMGGILALLFVFALLFTGCSFCTNVSDGAIDEPKAVLTLGTQTSINVKIITADDSDVSVSGAGSTKSIPGDGSEIVLTGTEGGTITLTGNITGLFCEGSQLTALDVSTLTLLTELYCDENNISSDAFTTLLNALPSCNESDNAKCILYRDIDHENNCKDFTQPEALEEAVDTAKSNHWALRYYINATGWETADL